MKHRVLREFRLFEHRRACQGDCKQGYCEELENQQEAPSQLLPRFLPL